MFRPVAVLVALLIVFFEAVFASMIKSTVLPAKSDSDIMFCLQSYQECINDRSLVY